MKATAKDLRFHSKELIDSVRRGEEGFWGQDFGVKDFDF